LKLGVVIGVVWSSRKTKELDGCRLCVVQPVSSNGGKQGNPVVAADPKNISASGETVLYVSSTDAVEAFDTGFAPVNASIVGLVDEVV
jgi:ethanolamine utilization protein EutN